MASQDPKRLKMSSPSDDDAPPPPSDPNRRRGKRRKIAIFLGYCGAGYQGMQKNPGARTIESELELALDAAGAVPDADRGCPKRYDWARSARTDKGVSAAAQVVSGRFFVEPEGLVDRLNSALDPQIRIFGFKRATASFNAKKFCDRRRYIYLLPVFALDPSAHRDRESVAASLGSGSSELAKCLECSERGRKVPGIMGRQSRVPMEEERITDLGAGMVVDGAVNSNPSTESVIRASLEVEQTDLEVDMAVDGAVNLNPTTESVYRVSNSMEEEKADIGVGMGDDGSVNLNPSIESVIRISMVEEQTDLGVVDVGDGSAVSLKSTIRVSMVEEKTNIGAGRGASMEEEKTNLGAGRGALMEEEKTNLGAGRGGSMEEEKFDLDGAINSNPSTVSAMRVSNAEGETVIGNGETRAVGVSMCAVFPSGDLLEGTGISVEKVETEICSNDSHTGKTKVWKEEGLTELVTQESPFEEVKITVETCALEEHEKVESKRPDCINGEQIDAESIKFFYGEKEKDRFNGILKRYVGTHNFHNFTTRTKAEDPSAQRYIISFTANSVVTIDGIDFIKCEVVGQSFMLHQIRKMIGFAVAIMRNCTPESLMDMALRKDVNINVPTAPEVGLYLDECFFSSYNNKWRDTHEELTIESYAEQSEEFKMKYIYSHIASMEHKEGAVALWLHSLNLRNYPDFNYLESKGQSCNAENSQEADKSTK